MAKNKKIAKKRAAKRKRNRRIASGKLCNKILKSGRCKKVAVKNGKCDLHAEHIEGVLKAELNKYLRSRLPRRKKRSRKNPLRRNSCGSKHRKIVRRRRNPGRKARCCAKTSRGKRCKNICRGASNKTCWLHR